MNVRRIPLRRVAFHRRRVLAVTACGVLFVGSLLPNFLGLYSLHITDIVLINVLVAVGLNFILGFGGQISLCQAAFFGFGAYGYSVLALRGVPTLVAAIVGVAVGMAAGLAIGWPTLKLRGHYLALGTLGFGIIFSQLIANFVFTGAANGLTNVPPLSIGPLVFDTDQSMYYLLLLVCGFGVLASILFVRSPLGMRARAMRDDEIAADVAGVNIERMKVTLFVTSAAYAAVGGVLYASLLGYVSPDAVKWDTTFNYLMMVVVGGLGSTLGTVAGAVILTLLPENLRFLQAGYLAVFGLIVMILMAVAPGGLNGLGVRLYRLIVDKIRTHRRPAPSAGDLSEQVTDTSHPPNGTKPDEEVEILR